MMDSKEAIARLEAKDIKPTANRILVLKMLVMMRRPMSLSMLDEKMPNMDKSSIFRVLTLFLEHDVVHAFEDGRGVLNYELCEHRGHCNHTDGHIHFYCESCQRSFCLEDQHLPHVDLPDGFYAHAVSFVIKGECAECRKKHRLRS
ncbi:MAG: transcriptional repressor [Prevotella sp.]|nr:transcriptional repressor [Prevotella sp.]